MLLQEKTKINILQINSPQPEVAFRALEQEEENSSWFLRYFSHDTYTNPNHLGKHKPPITVSYHMYQKGRQLTGNLFQHISGKISAPPYPTALHIFLCWQQPN